MIESGPHADEPSLDALSKGPLANVSAGDVDGVRLRALCESFSTEVVSLESLRGVPAEELRTSESPHAIILRSLSDLTVASMQRMNETFPGLPPDSFERTLDLVSTPGARTVLLTGIVPGEEERGRQLLGYGIVILGRDNIPDRHHIPDDLLVSDKACRIIRLFVTETAREFLPRGEAFSKIIDEIKKLVGDGPGIAMVLSGIEPVTPLADSTLRPDRWLDAQKALHDRGVDDTGRTLVEKIVHPDGTEVNITFGLAVWPQVAEATKHALALRTAKYEELETKTQQRLAWAASSIPATDGRIIVSGGPGDAFSLARLYPADLVVGIHYQTGEGGRRARVERSPNLTDEPANESGRYFPANSVHASLVFGTLADLALDGERTGIRRFIDAQATQLMHGKSFVVREPAAPEGPKTVDILLSDKRSIANQPSPAEAFIEFCATPREPHISRAEWQSVVRIQSSNPGFQRFVAPYKIVAEFRAKWPYYDDWKDERKRPYAFLSSREREGLLESAGLRLIQSTPEHNLFQRRTFDDGQIVIRNLAGVPLSLPTSHVTIAEKIGPGEGVRIVEEQRTALESPRFLVPATFAQFDSATGVRVGVQEIVARAGITHDVIPYFVRGGKLFVRARQTPRPVVATHHALLDESHSGAYLPEQVSAIRGEERLSDSTEINQSAATIAVERAGLNRKQIVSFDQPTRYFTRADTVDEEVLAQGVKITADYRDRSIDNPVYGLATKPQVRVFDVVPYLQGCAVGTFQEGRLERKIYHLLQKEGLDRGAWLGDRLGLSPQTTPQLHVEPVTDLFGRTQRSSFLRLPDHHLGFFQIYKGDFVEYDPTGARVGTAALEYIEPNPDTGLGMNTLTVFPVVAQETSDGRTEILAGIELRDFAAIQRRNSGESLATVPTFRVPKRIESMADAETWVRGRMTSDFGVVFKDIARLGGKYRTSPGITAESAFPMVGEVDLAASTPRDLIWVRLDDLYANAPSLRCAQLLTSTYRAAHMLKVQ